MRSPGTETTLKPASVTGGKFVFRNAALALSTIWLATTLSALFGFASNVALAHALSVSSFGAYSAAITTVALAGTISSFGTGAFWLRMFGLEGARAGRWIGPTLSLVSVTSTAAILSLAVIAPATFGATLNRDLILILMPLALSQTGLELCQTRYQLEERHNWVAAIQTLPNLGRLLAALMALFFSLNAVETGLCLSIYSVAVLLIATTSLLAAAKSGFHLPAYRSVVASDTQEKPPPTPTLRDVLAKASPFALATISYPLYFQGGLLTLSIAGDNHATGIFSAAFLILTAIYLLPAVTYQKFLTGRMHWWAEHDRLTFAKVHRTATLILLTSGIVIAVVVHEMAQPLVDLLYANRISEAGSVLSVLALAIPFRFLSSAMGGVLLTGQNVGRRATHEAVATVITIGLTLMLLPGWGVIGVAMASVMSEMYLCAVYTFMATRLVRPGT
jgi:O-antigen/teichoic acid export membrane protein